MRIVVLCATRRGLRFVEKLFELVPNAEVVVFSFQEAPWEPPYLEDLRRLVETRSVLHEAQNVNSGRWHSFWDAEPIDLMLLVSWRFLVSPDVYRRARLGSFVFHDSLLPEYRGFAPTPWAIINGESHSGVTLFEIAEEVDAGDIVNQQKFAIEKDDTIADVMERITEIVLRLLERNLPLLLAGTAPRTPQDHSKATFCCKRLPDDNRIDWTSSTADIYNLIRATSAPYTGAFTHLLDRKLTVWSARPEADSMPYVGRVPGRIVRRHIGEGAVVLTGDGCLWLNEVQLEPGKIVQADRVLKSLALTLS